MLVVVVAGVLYIFGNVEKCGGEKKRVRGDPLTIENRHSRMCKENENVLCYVSLIEWKKITDAALDSLLHSRSTILCQLTFFPFLFCFFIFHSLGPPCFYFPNFTLFISLKYQLEFLFPPFSLSPTCCSTPVECSRMPSRNIGESLFWDFQNGKIPEKKLNFLSLLSPHNMR